MVCVVTMRFSANLVSRGMMESVFVILLCLTSIGYTTSDSAGFSASSVDSSANETDSDFASLTPMSVSPTHTFSVVSDSTQVYESTFSTNMSTHEIVNPSTLAPQSDSASMTVTGTHHLLPSSTWSSMASETMASEAMTSETMAPETVSITDHPAPYSSQNFSSESQFSTSESTLPLASTIPSPVSTQSSDVETSSDIVPSSFTSAMTSSELVSTSSLTVSSDIVVSSWMSSSGFATSSATISPTSARVVTTPSTASKTTPPNKTSTTAGPEAAASSGTGIAVGVVMSCIVLIVIVIVVYFVFKRRTKSRELPYTTLVSMELNPAKSYGSHVI